MTDGYIPIAIVYGDPNSNTHCLGFNKSTWVDNNTSKLFVAWFSDKVSEGVAFFVISIKV